MNFTFAMITASQKNPNEDASDETVAKRIWKIVQAIESENIPEYQFILLGGSMPKWLEDEISNRKINFSHWIPDPEIDEQNLIGRKKNYFVDLAQYENIVYMHDYICPQPGWYKGMLEFGNDFQVMINKIYDSDGKRGFDWFINVDPHLFQNKVHPDLLHLYNDRDKLETIPHLLPYDVDWMYHHQFIPGMFWIAKKHVMRFCPLHPELQWGQAEDIEWSFRVRDKFKISMNTACSVKFIKPGKTQPKPLVELGPEEMKVIHEMKQTGWDNRIWAKDYWDKVKNAGHWTEEHENHFTSWKHFRA
ncbi:MAG: hypothetical protein CBC29_05830 [Methylococcaceae bacterium TMED69]|nr:MAG: hypothetical protein CBC29_05830 [Methylococcaceae bacterium TMED69]